MSDKDRTRRVARQHIFSITARWGERAETPEALASRWIKLVARLGTVDPALARWMHFVADDDLTRIPFDPRLDAQVSRVIAGLERNSKGEPVPGAQSQVSNYTDFDKMSECFRVLMGAGEHGPYSIGNYASIGTHDHAIPEPRLVSYPVFRDLVLALAETFEATQAYAWPSDLADLWTREGAEGRGLHLAWISYIAPRFAPLVTPPPNAIVERRPDGGLLMAATDETFATANAAHLAAAHAIHAAVKPFNDIPWTVETGK